MFSIRRATLSDCELIHQLAVEVFPVTYKELLSASQMVYMMEWMYAPDNIGKQMEQGHVYFIADKEEEICGYLSIEQQEEDLFHLHKIYVLPSFQGSGAGGYLFDQAMRYIKNQHPNPCTMELNVNRNNKALQFYEHKGMKIVRQGDFPIGGGYYMNDYIMAIEL